MQELLLNSLRLIGLNHYVWTEAYTGLKLGVNGVMELPNNLKQTSEQANKQTVWYDFHLQPNIFFFLDTTVKVYFKLKISFLFTGLSLLLWFCRHNQRVFKQSLSEQRNVH